MSGTRARTPSESLDSASFTAGVVIPVLAARLSAVLGSDAWAAGHRAAALAFAGALIDARDLDTFVATPAGARYRETAEVLRRYLGDRRDTRGYPTS